MKKLNISIIGTGAIAESAHLPSLLSIPQTNIVSICDLKKDKLEKIGHQFNISKKETDYHRVLNDPSVEAVIVSTNAPMHEKIVLDSLKSGKHVFVEKPITTSIEAAEKILKLQNETNLSIMVGYQLRFMPNHIKVREYLKQDIVGKIYLGHIRSETLVIKPEETLLIDYGTHFFDLIRWYFEGKKIESVSGTVIYDNEIQVGATTTIVFEDNIQTIVEIYWVPKWNWSNVNRTAEFIGEKGKISTQMSIPAIKLWRCDSFRDKILGEKNFTPKEVSNVYMSAGDIAYRKQLEVFVDCILNNKPVPTNAYDGLIALKIAQASLQSHQEKKVITNIE
ncbi:MAG: Gfo/Idh/MocA family oxidoreductase [Patescibacteria group bacterium]|jgi:myo-inositol 2-dehydrogenase/D-chiro-inositol 1-dehydrogenase